MRLCSHGTIIHKIHIVIPICVYFYIAFALLLLFPFYFSYFFRSFSDSARFFFRSLVGRDDIVVIVGVDLRFSRSLTVWPSEYTMYIRVYICDWDFFFFREKNSKKMKKSAKREKKI